MNEVFDKLAKEWWPFLNRYKEFVLALVPGVVVGVLCAMAGALLPYFGGVAAGIVFWHFLWKREWVRDNDTKGVVRFAVGFVIFGYTCAGFGFVLGTWGVAWALPGTLFFVPFYLAYLATIAE